MQENPLPMKIMVVLCIVIFAEPVSLVILYPFLLQIVSHYLPDLDPKDYGFYAGLIGASFSIAQFFTSILWSSLSDRIGRRPVILIGLFGNIVTSILFGLAPTFWIALGARFTCGLINGNVAVAKCVLGEVTDKTNQAKGFSAFGFLFSTGSIVGSFLGGALASPVQQYPEFFKEAVFLKEFPFILAMASSAFISFLGLLTGYFWLPETLVKQNEEENQSLLEAGPEQESSLLNSVIPILCYSILAFTYNTFFEVYSIFSASGGSTSPGLPGMINLKAGLSFTPSLISLVFVIAGLIGLIVQLFIYMPIERRLGSWRGFQHSCLWHVVVLGTTSCLYFIQYDIVALWTGITVLSIGRSIAGTVAFTSVMVLINNSVQGRGLGFVNGVAQVLYFFHFIDLRLFGQRSWACYWRDSLELVASQL